MLHISSIAKWKLLQELLQNSEGNFIRIFIECFDNEGSITYAVTIDKLRKWDISIMYEGLPVCYTGSDEDFIENLIIHYDLKKETYLVKEHNVFAYKWEMTNETE